MKKLQAVRFSGVKPIFPVQGIDKYTKNVCCVFVYGSRSQKQLTTVENFFQALCPRHG